MRLQLLNNFWASAARYRLTIMQAIKWHTTGSLSRPPKDSRDASPKYVIAKVNLGLRSARNQRSGSIVDIASSLAVSDFSVSIIVSAGRLALSL
jgi:hypothetical protein